MSRASATPGCRLQRIEVFNWGTFGDKVFAFDVDGQNALLTGDIGSGKSTIVDAVSTLLLRSDRISYNKAAGAGASERSLRSYVLGHYKSERNETTGHSQPVGLRDHRNYSVLLGVFANVDYAKTVTVAQAFRMRNAQDTQPERFYVVADRELTITKDFADFGDDFTPLKKRLRGSGARVHDSFVDYGTDFRRQFGIDSEQAMELFHQTISMKAVDDLNEFVRAHMIEPFDVSSRITSLVDHFDDLNAAHDAIVRAKAQLVILDALVAELNAFDAATARITELRGQLDAAPGYFATRRAGVLEAELAAAQAEVDRLETVVRATADELDRLRRDERDLDVQISGAGGDRLATIEREITQLGTERADRQARLAAFNEALTAAGLEAVSDRNQFDAALAQSAAVRDDAATKRDDLDRQLRDHERRRDDLAAEADAVNAELKSLAGRESNIPARNLELRAALCAAVGVAAEELPFAGELVQVRDDAKEWEGAAERVLRNFALSLLVPVVRYGAVAQWINDNHLRTRLVYFRVPEAADVRRAAPRHGAETLLVDLLEVKPDTHYGAWLASELSRKADHVCAGSLDEFRNAGKAITREGQIKDRERHEKDDRHRIDDRREYVLGWSNQQKIDALIRHAGEVQAALADARSEIARLTAASRELGALRDNVTRLLVYEWGQLDWHESARRVADLTDERKRITATSDTLRALQDQKERLAAQIQTTEAEAGQARDLRGRARQRSEDLARDLEHARDAAIADADHLAVVDELVAALGVPLGTLTEIATAETRLRASIDERAEAAQNQRNGAGRRAVGQMKTFRSQYPQEVEEIDDSVEASQDYRVLHERISGDDLPRFEADFRRFLREHTIQDLLGLMATLEKNEEQIRQRIALINESLLRIDYNDGRYIALSPDPTPNIEVRQFRADLRACTENMVGGDDQYSEDRFLRVKAVIDRFKGREGSSDLDRNWTRTVTDVRQWFVFSASERWRNDDTEYENYSSSAGKSGGQKEKLAYTILAASLAYQFKLDFSAAKSRSFRFVVIDEAFGRGSDESTKYALKLFTSLGLQLLIVTPMQKLHVIEPHVAAVGFVDNVDGRSSRLARITISERKAPGVLFDA